MDPAKLKAAIECLKNSDGDAALALLEEMLTAAPGGDPETPEGALGEGADPTQPRDPNAPAAAAAATPAAAAAAAIDPSALRSAVETVVTALVPGAKTFAEASARIAGVVNVTSASELSERQDLIAELVKLRVETPFTAWAGKAEKRVPVARLASEPIADLRVRVAAMKAALPKSTERIDAPVVEEGELTDSERARMAKMTPEAKSRFIALRAQRRGTASART